MICTAIVAGLMLSQLAIAAIAFRNPSGQEIGHPLIRITGLVPVVLWFLSLAGVASRLAWAGGAASMLLHVLIAFHLGHGWSHGHAMEHVQSVGGWGEGIFVSYAFTAIWLADAAWWALDQKTHTRRPRRLKLGIHVFLAFVVFNATVVFGVGLARWFGVFAFLFLVFRCCRPAKQAQQG